MILTYSTFTWEKSKQTVRVLGFDRVTLGSWHIFNFRKPPRSMVRIRNTDTEGTVKEKRFVSSMWLLISICKLMNPWWLLILWKCLCYFLLWLLFFILFLCLFFVLFCFVLFFQVNALQDARFSARGKIWNESRRGFFILYFWKLKEMIY